MRIVINKEEHKQKVRNLCEVYNCSPTQLFITLIEQQHTRTESNNKACTDDKERTQHKNLL